MSDLNQVHAFTRQEGQSFWFLGTLMTLKASAETTNGAFSLIEQVAPAGFAIPLHVHHAAHSWSQIGMKIRVWLALIGSGTKKFSFSFAARRRTNERVGA